jgi:hypothetical protein
VLHPGQAPYHYTYMTRGDYTTNEGKPDNFAVVSVGPNCFFDSMADGGIDDIYDPTNGTLSRGDIVRSGP